MDTAAPAGVRAHRQVDPGHQRYLRRRHDQASNQHVFVGAAVELDAVTRRYRVRRLAGPPAVVALDRVSFAVAAGAICGVLGHNGAGKTTLLEILATLLNPHGGHARVMGHDVVTAASAVRRNITFAPAGGTAFFPRLTGRQNLEFFAALYDIPRAEWLARGVEAAEWFAIADALDRRVDTYSDGMRQRLGLARAAMSRARIWLLDEPTRGLDPSARALTQSAFLTWARDRGTTMLISTHDLAEAETICDQIVVLHHGRVTLDRPTPELRAQPGALVAAYGAATHNAGVAP